MPRVSIREFRPGDGIALAEMMRENGAYYEGPTCDTWIDSPLSVPFWEKRMRYTRRAVILRKEL